MNSAVVDAIETAKAEGYVKTKFFEYNRTENTLATGGGVTPTDNFQISNVSDFLLWYINGSVFQPAGTNIAAPDILVNLQDSNSGWMFSDQPVHWVQTVGTAQNPFILPDPRLLNMNSTIQLFLNNQTGGTLAQVNLCLAGLQVFYYKGFTRDDLPVQL
jgi:hypothetical protein